MLEIDTTTQEIAITRGDSAAITFGAVDENNNVWNPSSATDTIKFAVSKKWGGEVLMNIVNENDGSPYTEVEIDSTTFNADKTKYYTESGGTYTQCESTDTYDADETYYVKDWASFWTISIDTDDWLNNGSDIFKFTSYVYDVQVTTSTGSYTIIGKTKDLEPKFTVLGEVAEE